MELVPQPFDVLLRRAAHELAAGACFDLPARSFHRAPAGLDFSGTFHGERAGNGLGPAAGPQSQLAQNLVLSYLAGGRVMELKTVQILDTLKIPRPCIDAANVGFNVEWSQELRLTQSFDEYVKGWVLLHALRHADLGLGLSGPAGEPLFDMSVGYDLKGIQSAPVQQFLDGMQDGRAAIDAVFDRWPRELHAWRPPRERVPNRLSSCITLSTFHGCPADEIERICEHLLSLGVHVVVKLNPTLLTYDGVRALLHDTLGYTEIRPHEDAFAHDLKWAEALQMVRRLSGVAQRKGLTFGAKFSNTLVVENHKPFFPGSEKVMYLSGAPLHVLTFELCRRFREAYADELPVSFSAGVDNKNYADCVAAGFVPITTCTDLLKPGGYARLPKYLDNLAARMKALCVATVEDFILAQSGSAARVATTEAGALPALLHRASLTNHAAAAKKVLVDPRYAAKANSAVPRRIGTKLWFFDCVNCDKCVQVCPNDANFSVELPEALTAALTLPDLVLRAGALAPDGAREFKLKDGHQLANYADFCNECGNCDVFCPEEGGPYLVKPRFFGSRRSQAEAGPTREGFVVEQDAQGSLIEGRHEGQPLRLRLDAARASARYDDGAVEVELSYPDFARWTLRAVHAGAPEGHRVRLDRARALAALLHGALLPGAANPVSAPFLPAVGPDQVKV